jgi:hypothetical protein
MAMRSCRVTIQDLDGVVHTVEATASTLYEAVAQGLAAIRGREWVAGVSARQDGEMNPPLHEAKSRSLTPLAKCASGFGMTILE